MLDEVNEHTGRTIVMAYDDDQRRVETWSATDIPANGTTYSASNQLVVPTSWALRTRNTLDADGRLTRTDRWPAVSVDAVRAGVGAWRYVDAMRTSISRFLLSLAGIALVLIFLRVAAPDDSLPWLAVLALASVLVLGAVAIVRPRGRKG